MHWYKKTFPNSDWKLFNGPADIYMVCLSGFLCYFLGSLSLHDSYRFSYLTFCKQLVVSLISGGLLPLVWDTSSDVTVIHDNKYKDC